MPQAYPSQVQVQEARAYDAYYDPLYTSPQTQLYRGAETGEAVEGSNLSKYHKRPLVPYLSSIPADIFLAPPAPQIASSASTEEPQAVSPTREMGVQTDYRDAQTQTDPYTPDFVVPIGEKPEILALAHLYYNHGLPAGQLEIEQIEHDRKERLMNSLLPPHTDEASFEIRREMMEKQELESWNRRSNEIDEVHRERLELLRVTMEGRDAENMAFQSDRVDTLRQRKLEDREEYVASLQKKRIQVLRQISKKEDPIPHFHKRDIIEDYSDFGSNIYAPIARKGVYPDQNTRNYDVFTQDLGTKDGIDDFVNSLPASIHAPSVSKPSKQHVLKREERQVFNELEYLDGVISSKEERKEKQKFVVPFWRKPKEKIVRPEAPVVDDGEDYEFTNSILLLQKLLRGRSVQNLMFEGKEKRLPLIKELRSDEYIREIADVLDQQTKEMEVVQSHNQMKDSVVSAITGEVIAGTVDYLGKELVRVKEQERIRAFIKRAEENRRVREAEEGGRRQTEIRLRNRKQMVYQNVQRIHKETVLSLTDSLFDWAVDRASLNKAYEQVFLKKMTLSSGLLALDDRLNRPSVVVRDLVASFLLPEVEREKIAEEIRKEQQKYPVATQQALGSIPRLLLGEPTGFIEEEEAPSDDSAIAPSSSPETQPEAETTP